MVRRQRLDAEMVRRDLARSRKHAAELVAQGHVTVGGRPATKASTQVEVSAAVAVSEPDPGARWASRGAHKLIGALEAFPAVVVHGRRCLDAGASTGGFTDVLLDRGAAHVVSVDVGYGQLVWRLRTDERVTVLDRTNVRSLRPEQVSPSPELLVADLSFISLRHVLPALAACSAPTADLVLMVKPQFEVGRGGLGAGGVVRESELRVSAVTGVAAAARESDLAVRGVAASPLPGPSGNVEYFLWLGRGADGAGDVPDPAQVEAMARLAVAQGPQDGLPGGGSR